MNDEDMIRAVIGARTEAMSRKDAVAAAATLAPDIVAFELAPPLRIEAEQARDVAGLQSWFDTWSGPIGIDIRDLSVVVSGDVAFCHSLNRLSGTKTSGAVVDMWMRSTLGFRRISGSWKIVHGHTSVPFRMDGSYQAALDLQP